MDQSRFAVEVISGPDEARLVFTGDIDVAAEGQLASAYDRASALEATRVTLDFSGVGYINSTGIALIVRLLADARRDGRKVRAEGLTEHYREIFRITRLSDFMDIADQPAAAGIEGGRS